MAAILICCFTTISIAFADKNDSFASEDSNTTSNDEQNGGGRIVKTNVIPLGTVPFETSTEKECDVIFVADVATNVLINEKNTTVKVPVGGAVVQLMTVLVALDYLQMDEVISVTEQQLKDVTKSTGNFGLDADNEVLVEDLIVSMLYNGALDSAKVITDEVIKRTDVESFGTLMAQKAKQLGMESTDYSNCDGIGAEQLMTTAMDQCELYLEALNDIRLVDIMGSGVYTVQSYNNDINENIPEKLTNNVTVTVPENKYYDIRLSSAVSCTVETEKQSGYNLYNVVFYHAKDAQSDIVLAIWMRAGSRTIHISTVTEMVDIFSKRNIVDLVPYIKVAANSFNITKSGVNISGWSLQDDDILYGCQMISYDPDAKTQSTSGNFDISKMTILLDPEQDTYMLNDDGSRTISVKVLINNSVVKTVELGTAAKASSEKTSEQESVQIYTDDDVVTSEPTLMSQYGWMIITGAVALLAIIVIIIGVSIRNRMER